MSSQTDNESSWIDRLGVLDLEGTGRSLSGIHAWIVATLAVALAVFILLINSFLLIDVMKRSSLFLSLLLALVFLSHPLRKTTGRADNPAAFDYILAAAGMACGLYLILIYDRFATTLEMTALDMVVGTAAVILSLEAGRRCLGWWLPALCVLFILYALYGKMLPSPLGHFGVRPERFIYRMFMVSEGLFGTIFQIAQSYIGLFVLFGAFLVATGATDVLARLGLSVSGRYAGGPAKVAVVASALTGMISGSAAANVATTGTMTIPMMKRVGFMPHFAGAVESIASTGGLITPPIMGAAAFLMVEFIGVPYLDIITAAILPALLYYGSLMAVIHFRAVKRGIRGLPANEIPSLKSVVFGEGYLLLPLVILIIALLAGYTPIFAALFSIAAIFVVSFFKSASRLTPLRLLNALMKGGASLIGVSMACMVAGIIVGVVSMTGVAEVFTSYIEAWSQGHLLVALVLTALAAILLSCALPATAVYIVVAVTIAPSLIKMGAPPLSAHFFVFWYGALSNITPPVAIACFTAAGIAGANPGKIAFTALRMALPAFLISFLLVYYPSLLFVNWTWTELGLVLIYCVVGIGAYVLATEGYFLDQLRLWERVVFLVCSALCLLAPGAHWIGNIGFLLTIGLAARCVVRFRRRSLQV
ncbi:TRAP transporter permease [Shumkonia mesophila]|uniref:TRAP transporter permease n=1 Tax=Shumkonia mesophila TaxID=2838854 RepID=UPI00293449BB|nr:TRAP transporter fused permease subunit [Shumkonia mesophila]